jgi:two-component system sensor histidine kinase KdpD
MQHTLEWRNKSLRLAAGLAAVACLTSVAFRLHLNLSTATSLHLLLVSLIALRWGFWEASLTSFLSVLCLDYFFTQPLFALYMSDAHDWIALGTFEAVALLVSRLSNQIRHHAFEAEMQRQQMERLYDLSQSVLLLDQQRSTSEQMGILIRNSLALESVAIWDAVANETSLSGRDEHAREEARAIYTARVEGDDLATGYSRRLLRIGERLIGAMVAHGTAIDSLSMDAAASLTALAMEHARVFAAQSRAEAERQSEQLRTAVLDGLAHAFKTPLTTILASSSGLLEIGDNSATQRELVSLIDEQARQLNELSSRLLTAARLDSQHIRLRKEKTNLADLLRDIVRVSQNENEAAEIVLQIPTPAPTILVDVRLLRMALCNLIDNATKYASPGSRIAVKVQRKGAIVVIQVMNEGSFITVEERQLIFQRFYRSPKTASRVAGSGIGLAVTKRIAEAHRGEIWAESDERTGTTFSLTLPCIETFLPVKPILKDGDS